MKKFIAILICGLTTVSLIGCGNTNSAQTVKEQEKLAKEEAKKERENEKYEYILTSDKTYEELNNEEQGVNYIYMDNLIDGKKEYDSKYSERIESLKQQRQEILDKRYAEKKAEMEKMYGYVPFSEDVEQSTKQVNFMISNNLDKTKFKGKYKLITLESSVKITFDDTVLLSNVTKGDLTNLTRTIYDYYTEQGLARTETDIKNINVYFVIEQKQFKSSWRLGESPKDEWNE